MTRFLYRRFDSFDFFGPFFPTNALVAKSRERERDREKEARPLVPGGVLSLSSVCSSSLTNSAHGLVEEIDLRSVRLSLFESGRACCTSVFVLFSCSLGLVLLVLFS